MRRPEVFCRLRWLGIWLVSFWLAGNVRAAPTPKPAASPATAATSPAPAPSVGPAPNVATASVVGLSLNDIASKGQEALIPLKTLGGDPGGDQAVRSIGDAVPTLTNAIDELHAQATKATVDPGSSIDTLHNLDLSWQKLIDALVEHSETLGKRGRALAEEADKVKAIEGQWKATQQNARPAEASVPAPTRDLVNAVLALPLLSPALFDPTPLPDFSAGVVEAPKETLSLVQEVIDAAGGAQKRIQAGQKNILDLQNTVGALLARANAGQDVVDDAIEQAVKTLLVRDSPPLWSDAAQPKPDLAGRWHTAWTEETGQVHTYLDDHDSVFGIHLLAFLVLIPTFLYLRRLIHRWTEDEPHLKRAAPIFDVPIAAALAISFLVMGGRYADAPSLLQSALAVAALLPTVIILRRVLARRLYLMLYSLVLFTVVDQVRVATVTFPAVNRWLFCGEMVAAAGVFLWLWWSQERGDPASRLRLGRWMPFLCGLAVLIFAAALVTSVLGYVRLGALLGTATLKSSYTAVFLYAALRVLDGLIVIALRVRPVSASRIAQTHRDEVQAQVYNVFRALAVLVWLKYTLEQLQLYKPLYGVVDSILTYRIPLGEEGFRPYQIFYFAAALWLSTLVSRVLRFFLSEEVYERVQLAPGLPYAISTMLNYAVLFVGSIIALGLLGLPLTKFTLVASAFSVGLGFGLQNIINNFVSGIILLFERPIKVGDYIQLGDSTGEVRRIGIRASIIRTRDGSDIILPNGNMISNQVTNWTYADRSRAVELSFNVATGPDPAHVLAVLRSAADRQPATENRPQPEAYITALLPNGFTVVVHAWTGKYEDWIEVRSELGIALIGVLARENIKLV